MQKCSRHDLWPILTHWIMAIFSNGCKQYYDFGSRNSVMLSFTNIWGLLCWLSIFPCINFSHSCSMWEKPAWFWQFHRKGCFPLIWKDSTTHMLYDLAGYLKKGLPFARDLSLENSADSYVFGWLYFTQSVTYFSSIDCLLRFYARFLIPFFSIKMIYTSLLTTYTI